MGRWLDRLLFRSKGDRLSRQMDRDTAKRDIDALNEHRERQAHYREVTQSDERGRDTSPGARSDPPSEPKP